MTYVDLESKISELITPEDFLADIQMSAQETRGLIIFEGPDDLHLMRHHFDTYMLPMYAGGKDNIKKLIDKINSKNSFPLLFIVDRDFDSVLSQEIKHENVLITDNHDLVMDFILSNEQLIDILIEISITAGRPFTFRNINIARIKERAFTYADYATCIRYAMVSNLIPPQTFKKFSFKSCPENPTLLDVCHVYSSKSDNFPAAEKISVTVESIYRDYFQFGKSLIGDHLFISALGHSINIENGLTTSTDKIKNHLFSNSNHNNIGKINIYKNIKLWFIENYSINPFKEYC